MPCPSFNLKQQHVLLFPHQPLYKLFVSTVISLPVPASHKTSKTKQVTVLTLFSVQKFHKANIKYVDLHMLVSNDIKEIVSFYQCWYSITTDFKIKALNVACQFSWLQQFISWNRSILETNYIMGHLDANVLRYYCLSPISQYQDTLTHAEGQNDHQWVKSTFS